VLRELDASLFVKSLLALAGNDGRSLFGRSSLELREIHAISTGFLARNQPFDGPEGGQAEEFNGESTR
jgi:hypothetical protein